MSTPWNKVQVGYTEAQFTKHPLLLDSNGAPIAPSINKEGFHHKELHTFHANDFTPFIHERGVLDFNKEQAKDDVQRRATYLAELQQLSRTGSFGWNVSTGEICWSEESYRIAGYDPAIEPTLELMFERIHPEDIGRVRETLERAARDGTDLDLEHRFLMPEGTVKYVHVLARPIRDQWGNLEYVGAEIDVTERREARRELEKAYGELKKSEAQLRTIINAIPTQAWCALPDGSMDFQNQQWLDYTGLSPEAAHGWGWQVALHPDDAARHMKNWLKIQASEAHGETEARFRRFDGEYRWFLIRVEPVHDEHGNTARWYGTNTDIEDRKRTEDELHRAQAELAHIARVATLGEMTASIAHEISHPLGAMVINASACLRWLAAQNLEEARNSAELVVADGHRAGEIIGRIRALVRRAPRREDWLDINETILDVIALARNQVDWNHVSLETRFVDNLPLIQGDRIQLQQVILNLIINAIEAMSGLSQGPRELLVASEIDQPKGVLVDVRDSGPGLDPRSLDRLFDAFYTTKPHGMGMGLAISRSIIEDHGGRLWALANENSGAVFRFRLPAGDERVS